MEWSVCSLLQRRHLLQHFSSNQRVRRPFSSRHAPVNVMLSSAAKHKPGKVPWKPPVLPWEFLHVGVSVTAALRARRNHLGSLSKRYSRLGGVSQIGRDAGTGHEDETAASCLEITQIISSTHISIEAAVAMETHPPSPSSSSTERETFPSNWAAQTGIPVRRRPLPYWGVRVNRGEGRGGSSVVSSVTHLRTTYMLFSQEVHDLKVNMPGYTDVHCRKWCNTAATVRQERCLLTITWIRQENGNINTVTYKCIYIMISKINTAASSPDNIIYHEMWSDMVTKW